MDTLDRSELCVQSSAVGFPVTSVQNRTNIEQCIVVYMYVKQVYILINKACIYLGGGGGGGWSCAPVQSQLFKIDISFIILSKFAFFVVLLIFACFDIVNYQN